MFRIRESALPKEFYFPNNLAGLGYFINPQDQIRSIEDPLLDFHYFFSTSEHAVVLHREAMDDCLRQIVLDRMLGLGLQTIRLPLGALDNQPHVPIMISANLAVCTRVVVYLGEETQDLGMLAHRLVGNTSIDHSTIIETIKGILLEDKLAGTSTGIIIANPGQLLWYRRGQRAMTYKSWDALPGPHAVGSRPIVSENNFIPDNANTTEHVVCVFGEILSPMAKRGCKINVIAVNTMGTELLNYLQHFWKEWEHSMAAVAILTATCEFPIPLYNQKTKAWFAKRGRAFVLSKDPLGTPLPGRQHYGCNIYSGGENTYLECIMPRAHPCIMNYFGLVAASADYANHPQNFAMSSFGAIVSFGRSRQPIGVVYGPPPRPSRLRRLSSMPDPYHSVIIEETEDEMEQFVVPTQDLGSLNHGITASDSEGPAITVAEGITVEETAVSISSDAADLEDSGTALAPEQTTIAAVATHKEEATTKAGNNPAGTDKSKDKAAVKDSADAVARTPDSHAVLEDNDKPTPKPADENSINSPDGHQQGPSMMNIDAVVEDRHIANAELNAQIALAVAKSLERIHKAEADTDEQEAFRLSLLGIGGSRAGSVVAEDTPREQQQQQDPKDNDNAK